MWSFRARFSIVSLICLGALATSACRSIGPAHASPPAALKQLSLEELMAIEVTSATRTPTPLLETSAAVQILTREEIRRSGATTLAEALRLAPALQVAQVNAHDWAITARGFNGASVNTGSLADKLLVMIDGRSVYTPLFGGVFWDVQHVPLEDVERIEIVSGPGGTSWGANAVNGVINVITRSADETQGAAATIAAGSDDETFGAARYGGSVGNVFYRGYAQRFDRGDSKLAGADAHDDWELTQGGFRTDTRHASGTLTVQGDFYEGRERTPDAIWVNGQNVLARWTRGDWVTQLYFDRTTRSFPRVNFREELQTADLDAQHRFAIGARHRVVWGFGYRHMWDDVRNGTSFGFVPAKRTMRLISGFLQDEVSLTDAAKLTIGAKLEHNEFSGLEAQPGVRLAWMLPRQQMTWAAVSRAVRSPARFDTEIFTRTTVGNPDFAAETVIAYEVGYRITPLDALVLSVAAFHNRYGDIRSIDAHPAPPPALRFGNGLEAQSNGIELSGRYQPASWWRLRGGYTHLRKTFRATEPGVLAFSDAFEAQDPRHQIIVQSIVDLPRGVQFDTVARWVAEIAATPISRRIAPYAAADVRIAWRVSQWELSLLARNLGGAHPEFASPVVSHEIPRAIEGRLRFAW